MVESQGNQSNHKPQFLVSILIVSNHLYIPIYIKKKKKNANNNKTNATIYQQPVYIRDGDTIGSNLFRIKTKNLYCYTSPLRMTKLVAEIFIPRFLTRNQVVCYKYEQDNLLLP